MEKNFVCSEDRSNLFFLRLLLSNRIEALGEGVRKKRSRSDRGWLTRVLKMFHYLSTAINVSSKGRIFLKYSSFCQTIRRAKKYRRRATISHASRPSYYFRGIRNSGRECLEYFIRFNPFIRRIPIFIESSFPIFTSLSLSQFFHFQWIKTRNSIQAFSSLSKNKFNIFNKDKESIHPRELNRRSKRR